MNEYKEIFKFVFSLIIGGCFWISVAIGLLKLFVG